MTDLRFLNPFVDNAVHEADIWGEEGGFRDVESIHGEAFRTLLDDLEEVAQHPSHRTKVRFLVGMGGSGKSHLFSRLRRRLGEGAVFAFASNPPTSPRAFVSWALGRVVDGLRRPRLVAGEVKPYSQLEALVYQQGLGLGQESLDSLHEYWTWLSNEGRRTLLEAVRVRLGPGFDSRILQGVLAVLQPEHRATAFRWLSGSSNLGDEELEALGQQRPLEDDEAETLLLQLGRLSEVAGAPLVLILDQLDLMTRKEQVDEIQRLLFGLINASSNWYVVVGLIEDKYALWAEWLTEALRTRIQAPDGHLPLLELSHLDDPGQKDALVRQRLEMPSLRRAREERGEAGDTFPLAPEDCRALASGPPVFPRELLAQASARYVARVTGATEPQEAESLEERLHLEFRQRRERLEPAELSLEPASLADRVVEAAELLARAKGLGPVTARPGPLEDERGFKGTDTLLDVAGREIRIVGHHVHRGPAFPTFLRRVAELPARSLLVRDGAAGVTGRVTTERLEAFKGGGRRFLHLPRPAFADLVALGELLAEAREGNFSRLSTEPPPTDENVRAALATLPWITAGPLALALLDLMAPEAAEVAGATAAPKGEAAPAPAPEPPTAEATATPVSRPPSGPSGAPIPTAALPEELASAVEALLRPTRWLMFERLRLWLSRDRPAVGIEQLRSALDSGSLATAVLRYPRTVARPEDVQILIWNDDDA